MKKLHLCLSLLALTALSLVTLIGPVGCKSAAPAGTEIRIGVLGGQTGPASAEVARLFDEVGHVFEYINEVEGGIDGAKIKWRMIDNKGTPEGAITAYRELKNSLDPQIYFSVEDYYLLGIKDEIEADEAVIFTASIIQPQAFIPASRFFGLPIPISDGFAGYVKWVLENHEGPDMPKIGVLYWGDLATGAQWQMAQPWAMKQGVELVPVDYSIAAMDLKPQLLRLREAGVDYIWMLGIAPNAALAIGDFLSLGLSNEDIPFCFSEYVEADILLGMVGEAAEGFYVYRSETPYSDGSEAAELYTDIWEHAGVEGKWSDNRLLITLKAAITAAVKQAVEDVSWENLDSTAIYNALTGLTEIDTWGNCVGFGFGEQKRIGVTTMKIARFTKDGTVSASEPITLPRTFEGIDQ